MTTNLKRLRKNKKMTLKEVGNKIGKTSVYISLLEKKDKRNPSAKVLNDLVGLFGPDILKDFIPNLRNIGWLLFFLNWL